MTNEKLLLPLRVPELGPFMGKVVAGSGGSPGGLTLDSVRLRLATRLFECAGEARRLAAREERQAAVSAIGRVAWFEAWDEAVGAVADLLSDRITTEIEGAAKAARLSRRKRKRLRLDAAERSALRARLGSAGAALVPMLDRLELHATHAIRATALERDAVTDWQDALRATARRLEAAWLDLQSVVELEARRWERIACDVAAWRRPMWPVAVVGALALVLAAWLGLVLGGQLPAPPWLVDVWQRVFVP